MNWNERYSMMHIKPEQTPESILEHMLTPIEEGGHGMQDAYDIWVGAFQRGETTEDPSDPIVALRLLSLHKDLTDDTNLQHRHPKV